MKKGFTLAEILITLSIIGVIASMTIPSLVQDIQDAELKSTWKKTYSDLNQAAKRIMLDNGGNLKGAFQNSDVMKNKFKSYLNYIKDCNDGTSSGVCWNVTWKYLNGTARTDSDFAALILNNGSFVSFIFDDINCNSPNMGLNVPKCGRMFVDVNGFKGPNTIGIDIFGTHIVKDGIKPRGTQGDELENSCSKSDHGWGCAAKYLYE